MAVAQDAECCVCNKAVGDEPAKILEYGPAVHLQCLLDYFRHQVRAMERLEQVPYPQDWPGYLTDEDLAGVKTEQEVRDAEKDIMANQEHARAAVGQLAPPAAGYVFAAPPQPTPAAVPPPAVVPPPATNQELPAAFAHQPEHPAPALQLSTQASPAHGMATGSKGGSHTACKGMWLVGVFLLLVIVGQRSMIAELVTDHLSSAPLTMAAVAENCSVPAEQPKEESAAPTSNAAELAMDTLTPLMSTAVGLENPSFMISTNVVKWAFVAFLAGVLLVRVLVQRGSPVPVAPVAPVAPVVPVAPVAGFVPTPPNSMCFKCYELCDGEPSKRLDAGYTAHIKCLLQHYRESVRATQRLDNLPYPEGSDGYFSDKDWAGVVTEQEMRDAMEGIQADNSVLGQLQPAPAL